MGHLKKEVQHLIPDRAFVMLLQIFFHGFIQPLHSLYKRLDGTYNTAVLTFPFQRKKLPAAPVQLVFHLAVIFPHYLF